MDEIKQYKPIALVFYIDGNGERNALPLEESKRIAFKNAVETSKMVELEWITINTFDIKEIRPASSTSELEKFFYSQTWQDRNYIKQRTLKIAWERTNTLEYWLGLWEQQALDRLQRMLENYHETLSAKEQEEWN